MKTIDSNHLASLTLQQDRIEIAYDFGIEAIDKLATSSFDHFKSIFRGSYLEQFTGKPEQQANPQSINWGKFVNDKLPTNSHDLEFWVGSIRAMEQLISHVPHLLVQYIGITRNEMKPEEKLLLLNNAKFNLDLEPEIQYSNPQSSSQSEAITPEMILLNIEIEIENCLQEINATATDTQSETVKEPASSESFLTQNQESIVEKLKLGYYLYFQRRWEQYKIRPRCWPLICGPTGAGKSFLVKKLAEQSNADYISVTYGDWMCSGKEDSTKKMIIERALNCEKLIIHIDELDKWNSDGDGWSTSVTNDIFNLLDLTFAQNDFPGGMFNKDNLARIKSSIFIVGSGTWQDLFEDNDSPRRALGFGGCQEEGLISNDEMVSKIEEQRVIPRELFARFNSDLLILKYPKKEEIPQILKSSGITQLAKERNYPLDTENIDFKNGGMRVLESLVSNILLQSIEIKPE